MSTSIKDLTDIFRQASRYNVEDGIKAVIERLIFVAPKYDVLNKLYEKAESHFDALIDIRNNILGFDALQADPEVRKDFQSLPCGSIMEINLKVMDELFHAREELEVWKKENENLHKQLRAQQDELRLLICKLDTEDDKACV